MEWLNNSEMKRIRSLIEKQWGGCPDLDYYMTIKGGERVFLVGKESAKFDTKGLRVNSQGLYFGRLSHGEFKLSIEGSQIVGPVANKNVLELQEQEFQQWIRGLDLEVPGSEKRFVLIKHKDDFFGCARQAGGRLLNLVPKDRRIKRL